MSFLNSPENQLLTSDDDFDSIYPSRIRALSSRHWTPVIVARRAAAFLVRRPDTKVLDIGCGPGKFCIVGAMTTLGQFTGVEQRLHLVEVARSAIAESQIENACVLHKNIVDVPFSDYDAFYLFNPFAENLMKEGKIDASVPLSEKLYKEYTFYVLKQLALAPLGARVATYWGPFDGVPIGYRLCGSSLGETLKFWQKVRTVVPSNRRSLWESQIAIDCTKFLF